jgi:hypothetical protein
MKSKGKEFKHYPNRTRQSFIQHLTYPGAGRPNPVGCLRRRRSEMENLIIRFRSSSRRRPFSSTQIQSQGAKRKFLSPCASWGSKRPRSALGGGGDGDKQVLSRRSAPPPPHTNNRCGGQPATISVGCGGGKAAPSIGSPPQTNNRCVHRSRLLFYPVSFVSINPV